MKQTVMRPVDLLVLIHLAVDDRDARTYAAVASNLGVAASAVHGSVARARAARLMGAPSDRDFVVHFPAFERFLLHGAPYAFPATVGRPQRGIPTGVHAFDDTRDLVLEPSGSHVWPRASGTHVGTSIAPLHGSVPDIASGRPLLYQALAAFDALRIGNVRERELATARLSSLLKDGELA